MGDRNYGSDADNRGLDTRGVQRRHGNGDFGIHRSGKKLDLWVGPHKRGIFGNEFNQFDQRDVDKLHNPIGPSRKPDMSTADLVRETEGYLDKGDIKGAKQLFKKLGGLLGKEKAIPDTELKRMVELLQFAQAMQLVGIAERERTGGRGWVKEVAERIAKGGLARLGC